MGSIHRSYLKRTGKIIRPSYLENIIYIRNNNQVKRHQVEQISSGADIKYNKYKIKQISSKVDIKLSRYYV